MIGLWLVACAGAVWTPDGALEPHRSQLDRDGDGRVSAAEYDRTRWEGPAFAGADADGDGALSTAELLGLYRSQSPTTFDGQEPIQDDAPARAGWSIPPAQRDVWEALAWLSQPLLDAGLGGPDPVQLDEAVQSGDLDSEASRRVLASLQVGWQAQGWTWPAELAVASGPAALRPGDPSALVAARVRLRMLGPQGAAASSIGGVTGVPGDQ